MLNILYVMLQNVNQKEKKPHKNKTNGPHSFTEQNVQNFKNLAALFASPPNFTFKPFRCPMQ